MFVRNFYRAISALAVEKNHTIKTPSGTDLSINYSYGYYALRIKNFATYAIRTSYASGVVFGDGDTPESFEDYKLSGNVITGISGSASFSFETDETGTTMMTLFTIINNNQGDVTIKEIGLISDIQASNVLVERTVLDSPLTIPAGGVGQVTYTIRMNYPTA